MTATRLHRLGMQPITVLIAAVDAFPNSPEFPTFLGLVINIVAAIQLARGSFVSAGFVIIGAGLFDMVDGRVARETNQVTRFGGFFDSVLDRYSDLGLLIGLLVWYGSINRPLYVVLTGVVMMGLGHGELHAGSRRKHDSQLKVGFMERPERVALLIIGALFDRMAPTLWVLAVLSNLTVAYRMIFTWQETKRLEEAQLRAVPSSDANR